MLIVIINNNCVFVLYTPFLIFFIWCPVYYFLLAMFSLSVCQTLLSVIFREIRTLHAYQRTLVDFTYLIWMNYLRLGFAVSTDSACLRVSAMNNQLRASNFCSCVYFTSLCCTVLNSRRKINRLHLVTDATFASKHLFWLDLSLSRRCGCQRGLQGCIGSGCGYVPLWNVLLWTDGEHLEITEFMYILSCQIQLVHTKLVLGSSIDPRLACPTLSPQWQLCLAVVFVLPFVSYLHHCVDRQGLFLPMFFPLAVCTGLSFIPPPPHYQPFPSDPSVACIFQLFLSVLFPATSL